MKHHLNLLSKNVIGRLTALLFGSACTMTLAAPVLAALITDPYVGATVSGSARQYSLICNTCSTESQALPGAVSGGPGYDSAAIDVANPGYAIIGTAGFAGPDALPKLGAYAWADILIDQSIPKTFFYQAGASSRALQKYTYSGVISATYQIDYTLDGTFMLGSADAASLMQLSGGLTVYGSGYNPYAEYNPTLDFNYVNDNAKTAGLSSFSLAGSVNFAVNPGDSFYVLGSLNAYANSSHQVVGSVDALNTLGMNFTSGDTSLLTAQISAVPVPGALWLFGSGIGVLVGFARTRTNRAK